MDETRMPPRIVHLQGGLRAVDNRSGTVFVQVDRQLQLLRFPAPPYGQLYATLVSLGFSVIGVEFVSAGPLLVAPDWWAAAPRGGFSIEPERRAWTEIRHHALTNQQGLVVDLGRRCAAHLGLLSIRLLQVSAAYSECYRAYANGKPITSDLMFDNSFVSYIEAAIHAFFSDAAAFRDFLSEFVWRCVLKQDEGVTSFKTFRSRAAQFGDAVADYMIAEGRSGWIKQLSDLRNDIIHVAPIGSNHPFPPCTGQINTLRDGGKAVSIKYALIPRSPETLDLIHNAVATGNVDALKQQTLIYNNKQIEGEDALIYAWDTINRLVDLAQTARIASSLQGSIPHVTEDDLVGPVILV